MASVDGGSTWSFTYNALGDRVQWAYSGGADQHFFDPEGNWLGNAGSYSLVTFGGRYFALYLGGNTLFNHVNALDSASMRTLQSGAVAEDILFYPWGDVWEVQGSGGYNFANIPYRDVTTTTDITTARFSSPNFGRWLSPDPIGKGAVRLDDPQTWNMYAYVRNSPATLTDPTGLWETGMQCGGNDTSACEGGFPTCVMSSGKPCGGEDSPEQGNGSQAAPQGGQDQNQPQEAQKPSSWDPHQPLPDDPSKLGPDWHRDPEHQAPNDERYVNDKTGDKVDWHKGQPGKPGWQGKGHWHHLPGGQKQKPQRHYPPGSTIKKYAPVAVAVGVAVGVIQTIIDTAPYWLPLALAF